MTVPFSLSIGAFPFVSVPLFIVGLISTYYLIRFKDKTPATWFMAGGLAGLTFSMLAWFLNTGVVFWGAALLAGMKLANANGIGEVIMTFILFSIAVMAGLGTLGDIQLIMRRLR